jgi:hypothetical protein
MYKYIYKYIFVYVFKYLYLYMNMYKREDFELSIFSSLLNESIFNIPNLLLGILSKKN